jgi:predicted secreted protein
MRYATWFAIYFIIWWTMLFAALPFAVRRGAQHEEAVAGAEAGAPARPRVLLALAITTIGSFAVLGLVIWIIEYGWF